MMCLYCEMWEVTPDDAAGLCASCRGAVRYGLLIPEPDPDTNGNTVRLVVPPASPLNPLGHELGADVVVSKPWLPELCLTLPEESDILASYRHELMSLYNPSLEAPKGLHERAARVISEIRGAGVSVWVHSGRGHAVLDRPRAVPYRLLVEFVELQTWIEDVLTSERAEELREAELRYVEHMLDSHKEGDYDTDTRGSADTARAGHTDGATDFTEEAA